MHILSYILPGMARFTPVKWTVDTSAAETITETINQQLDQLDNMSPNEIWQGFVNMLALQLPKLLKAVLFFAIGYVLILNLIRILEKMLKTSKIDPTLHKFITSTVKIVMQVVLCIGCVGILDINFMPMVATLGTLGLAVSLAVKDTLSNVAGGITVLFSHPFTTGDYVEINGQPGTIIELGLVYTQMQTVDNKIIYLPNGDVAKATVTNYSIEPVRRLDLTFAIKEHSDYEAVRAMLKEIVEQAPLAKKDPAANILITDQTFAYVKFTIMVWVNTPDLNTLRGYLIGEIRKRIAAEGL